MSRFLPSGHLALLGCRTIGQHGAGFHTFAVVDERDLVVAGGLVGALELGQLVELVVPSSFMVRDDVGGHVGHHARLLGQDDVAGVDGGAPFGAGAHQRTLGFDQRHGLTLHVGAHQRSVSLIVLQERNQGGADGNHLTRGDVHVIDGAHRHIDRFLFADSGKGRLLARSCRSRRAPGWPGR